MTVPVSPRLHSSQRRIALDVTGMGLAAIANQHDVAVVGMVAVVAHPVQIFLLLGLILELFGLDFELLALEPVGGNFCATVGATIAVAKPSQQAVVAKAMLAGQLASVSYLVQAYCAFVLLELS